MIYVKLVLSALFSCFIVVGGRMVVGEISPYSAMFIRFGVASALMFLLLWKRGELGQIKRLSGKQWAAFGCLSLSGVVGYNLFMLLGLETVPAARAGVVYGLFPLFTWVAAWLFLREKFTLRSFSGSLICLGGVLLALSRGRADFTGNLAPGMGDLWILLSLLCWVSYGLISTWLLRVLSPVFVTAFMCILAAFMLLPMALGEGLGRAVWFPEWEPWAVLVVQGVFSTTIAFLWYCEGLERLGAGKAALFMNLLPLGTVFMAAAFLSEQVVVFQVIGAAMVCLGVWVAGRDRKQDSLKRGFHAGSCSP